jgi:cell fate regulator YaaT (PSP1 superfamily)
VRITKIQFTTAGKLYDFSAAHLELKHGDRVLVETDRGKSIALVVVPPVEIPDEAIPEGIKPVLRLANAEEIATAARFNEKEREAHQFCMAKIRERNLDMKLVRVEYLYDGSKAIFYFTADGRIDFRELVKDLAHSFHTRIEMRQIGVRDEAKMVGGIGICGRELCCSTFLRDFAPVSVKMAKEQSLALNPTKISGQCGRLLCCLAYEFDTYVDLKKSLPKCGKMVNCGDGHCGEVIKQNILHGTVTVRVDHDRDVVMKGDEILPEQVTDRPKKSEGKPASPPPATNERRRKQPPEGKVPPAQQPAPTAAPNQGQQQKGGQGEKGESKGSGPSRNKRRRDRNRNRDRAAEGSNKEQGKETTKEKTP